MKIRHVYTQILKFLHPTFFKENLQNYTRIGTMTKGLRWLFWLYVRIQIVGA